MRVSAEIQVKPGDGTDFSLRHRDREKAASDRYGAKKRRKDVPGRHDSITKAAKSNNPWP